MSNKSPTLHKPKFTESLSPDWKGFELLPPWSVVSSRELASVLGVHLQTISNYVCRGHLSPEPKGRFRGNKNYFRISYIRSLFENLSEDQIEWSWVHQYMERGAPFVSLDQAKDVAKVAWQALGIRKPVV